MAVKIFCCYAHEDEGLLKKLRTHLTPLQRLGLIEVWHDRDINAGTEWEDEIKKQLESSEIILLLVSPDFMNSEYCYSTELQRALERHKVGEASVISVIVRPVYWQGTLGKLQVLPRDGLPVTEWPNIDTAFFNVAEGIRKVVEGLQPSLLTAISPKINVESKPSEVISITALSEEPQQSEQAKSTIFIQQNELNASVQRDLTEEEVNGSQGEVGISARRFDEVPHENVYKSSRIGRTGRLSSKRLCPVCFSQFYLSDCPIVSRRDQTTFKNASRGALPRLVSRLRPERLDKPIYVSYSATYACPSCSYLLPSNLENTYSLSFAVIGTPHSGVSHYLTALVHQLREGHLMPEGYNIRLTCMTTNEETDFIQSNINPIFHYKQALYSTKPSSTDHKYSDLFRPLIYELNINKSGRNSKNYNLIFYDRSGWDYSIPEKVARYGRYILDASAVIFLIDPSTIPVFVAQLPNSIVANLTEPKALNVTEPKAFSLFNSILNLLIQYRGLREVSSLNMPIAMALSKSDLLTFLNNNDFDIFWRDRIHTGFDLQDAYQVDGMVREFLQMYGERPLLNATQNLRHMQFFAVSATGSHANEKGVYQSITPHRCLDPILWILYQLGIIDPEPLI